MLSEMDEQFELWWESVELPEFNEDLRTHHFQDAFRAGWEAGQREAALTFSGAIGREVW